MWRIPLNTSPGDVFLFKRYNTRMKFFALGSHPTLSLAEIAAVLGNNLDFSQTSAEILLLEWVSDESVRLMERLSGVIKIGTIVGEFADWDVDAVSEFLAGLLNSAEGSKISFGISLYRHTNQKLADQIAGDHRRLGMEAKRKLKEAGHSARFVTGKERELSAVIVETNKLIENGAEFVLVPTANGVLVGQTEAVQDFRAWSDRDYGRPRRNAKAGMLPPKLARLMVNLTGAEPGTSTLLDPFCGSGTVLMEAALLGFRSLIGSDIDERAVKDTAINMQWLADAQGVELPPLTLFTSPAAELREHIKSPVDTIATETYLGPPASGKESREQLAKRQNELMHLYERSFEILKKVVRPNGTIVVAFPVFRVASKELYLPLKGLLETIGLTVQNPLPESTPDSLKKHTPNGGLLYARSDQHVGREIIVLSLSGV
jgi:tRNA (guanine10-N2)-dimethyltransferase